MTDLARVEQAVAIGAVVRDPWSHLLSFSQSIFKSHFWYCGKIDYALMGEGYINILTIHGAVEALTRAYGEQDIWAPGNFVSSLHHDSDTCEPLFQKIMSSYLRILVRYIKYLYRDEGSGNRTDYNMLRSGFEPESLAVFVLVHDELKTWKASMIGRLHYRSAGGLIEHDCI